VRTGEGGGDCGGKGNKIPGLKAFNVLRGKISMRLSPERTAGLLREGKPPEKGEDDLTFLSRRAEDATIRCMTGRNGQFQLKARGGRTLNSSGCTGMAIGEASKDAHAQWSKDGGEKLPVPPRRGCVAEASIGEAEFG